MYLVPQRRTMTARFFKQFLHNADSDVAQNCCVTQQDQSSVLSFSFSVSSSISNMSTSAHLPAAIIIYTVSLLSLVQSHGRTFKDTYGK